MISHNTILSDSVIILRPIGPADTSVVVEAVKELVAEIMLWIIWRIFITVDQF